MRRTPRILAAALLVFGLAACGSESPPSGVPSPAAASYPVTVGSVTLDARPEKIVSLSPTATEMLFAIGAGPQVIAVDDQSNFPAEAPKTDLSGFQPNAEAIAGQSPDLVVLSNDTNKVVDQLTQLSIPVLVAPAAVTLDDTYQQILDLGALTGHSSEASALTARMKGEIDKLVADVPARAEKLTYFYELGPELYSATSKTFVGSLFTMIGMSNIADAADADGSKGGYPQLAAESLVAADPDMIFLADTKCCQQSAATVTARAGWGGITAVKSGQIVALDDDIASRWGPRVVDLVRQITDAVAKVPA